jgi:hypothetical protein
MNERASPLLAAAGLIDRKVIVRDDDGGPEVQVHERALGVREQPRRRHLVSV